MGISIGSPHVLGIEINKTRTRVVEMNYKAKKPKIFELFEFKTPADMIKGGVVIEFEEFAEVLHNECKRRGVKTNKVIFTVMSTRIMEKEAVVPAMKPARIKDMIRLNATDYFPIDISQFSLSYEIVEKIGKGKAEQYRLALKAIPQDILQSYHTLAEVCGLQLVQIDYVMNGVYQMIKSIEAPRKDDKGVLKVYLVADITTARVLMIKDGRLVLQRGLIQSTKDANSLARATMRVLDYYMDRGEEGDAEENIEMILMGTASETPGLKEALEERLGQEVIEFDMVDGKLIFDKLSWPVAAVCDYSANIGACIYPLNLKLAEKKETVNAGTKISFQEFFLNDAVQSTILKTFIGFAISFVLLGAYYLYVALQGNDAYNEAVGNQMTQIAQLQRNKAAKEGYDAIYAEYANMIQLTSDLKTANDQVLLFLGELEDTLPSDAEVKRISFTETGASIEVEVTSWSSVAFTIMEFREMQTVTLDENSLPKSYEDMGKKASAGSDEGSAEDLMMGMGGMEGAELEDAPVTQDYSLWTDAQLRTESKRRAKENPELVGQALAENGATMTQEEIEAQIDVTPREELIRLLGQSDSYLSLMGGGLGGTEEVDDTPDHLYKITAAFEYNFTASSAMQNLAMKNAMNNMLAGQTEEAEGENAEGTEGAAEGEAVENTEASETPAE